MIRPVLFVVFILSGACSLYGQRAQRMMIGLNTDLIKSDNDGFFEKMQGGLEGNFYFGRKFAATAGAEWWSDDRVIPVAGVRFCPIDEAFVRLRALFRQDLSLGAGFAKPLTEEFRIEAMADYYFDGSIAIRAGIAFGFGGKP